jgi:hypothetical protein
MLSSLSISEKKGSDLSEKFYQSLSIIYKKWDPVPAPDPDLHPALDPALFISGLKDANKIILVLLITFKDTIKQHYSKIKSHTKSHKTV